MRPAQIVRGALEVLLVFGEAAEADVGAIPEDFVVAEVVAAAEEIGPVARLGDFDEAVVVAVVGAEPVHDALEAGGVVVEEGDFAGVRDVVIHRDDEPEAAVDGADAADAGVFGRAVGEADVGGNEDGDGVEERAERRALAVADIGLGHLDGLHDGETAVAWADGLAARVADRKDAVVVVAGRNHADLFPQGVP